MSSKKFKEMAKRISDHCKSMKASYACLHCKIDKECDETMNILDSTNCPADWTEEDIELMWEICKDSFIKEGMKELKEKFQNKLLTDKEKHNQKLEQNAKMEIVYSEDVNKQMVEIIANEMWKETKEGIRLACEKIANDCKVNKNVPPLKAQILTEGWIPNKET